MNNFEKLFATLPIHILTEAFSLFTYLMFLRFFDHLYPVTGISFFLLVINIISYFLYSFFVLRKYNYKTVFSSTLLFLLVGLSLWKVSQITASNILDDIYWIYHIVGFTSFVWYVELYIDPFLESYHLFGYLYSVIPSGIILVAFCLGKYYKR